MQTIFVCFPLFPLLLVLNRLIAGNHLVLILRLFGGLLPPPSPDTRFFLHLPLPAVLLCYAVFDFCSKPQRRGDLMTVSDRGRESSFPDGVNTTPSVSARFFARITEARAKLRKSGFELIGRRVTDAEIPIGEEVDCIVDGSSRAPVGIAAGTFRRGVHRDLEAATTLYGGPVYGGASYDDLELSVWRDDKEWGTVDDCEGVRSAEGADANADNVQADRSLEQEEPTFAAGSGDEDHDRRVDDKMADSDSTIAHDDPTATTSRQRERERHGRLLGDRQEGWRQEHLQGSDGFCSRRGKDGYVESLMTSASFGGLLFLTVLLVSSPWAGEDWAPSPGLHAGWAAIR